jgi:hypothetical protein
VGVVVGLAGGGDAQVVAAQDPGRVVVDARGELAGARPAAIADVGHDEFMRADSLRTRLGCDMRSNTTTCGAAGRGAQADLRVVVPVARGFESRRSPSTICLHTSRIELSGLCTGLALWQRKWQHEPSPRAGRIQ